MDCNNIDISESHIKLYLEIDIINFKLNKINNNNYKILYKNKKIDIDLTNIKIPFGIEKFNNAYYLNIELNNYKIIEYIKLFELNIETIIKQDINYQDFMFISNIKQNKNYLPLLKSRVINKNNKFICKSSISLFDIKKNNFYNIKLVIDSIWFNNNKFGLLWILDYIE